ncbi:hypothetical protein Q8G46_27835, partial [Klebsiella pneumoniae]|uniref:hypothetical protein n=1 Tax=Klebsiella pneumoniae TaxID=573 RepID=UPI00301332A0
VQYNLSTEGRVRSTNDNPNYSKQMYWLHAYPTVDTIRIIIPLQFSIDSYPTFIKSTFRKQLVISATQS